MSRLVTMMLCLLPLVLQLLSCHAAAGQDIPEDRAVWDGGGCVSQGNPRDPQCKEMKEIHDTGTAKEESYLTDSNKMLINFKRSRKSGRNPTISTSKLSEEETVVLATKINTSKLTSYKDAISNPTSNEGAITKSSSSEASSSPSSADSSTTVISSTTATSPPTPNESATTVPTSTDLSSSPTPTDKDTPVPSSTEATSSPTSTEGATTTSSSTEASSSATSNESTTTVISSSTATSSPTPTESPTKVGHFLSDIH
ncbi:uncharacterized protein LOC128313705 [Acinonyx jubatus]|uniref:Uncharacterized protein LOC128313705 n=1 Tax=Acinonyx jubatus TaxID=32536 RepID=A0ABM3PDP9_ACIJB|nr:uncharacterized protein LOC128313705 [Acinonyx jubatus]